jgi:beta-xylosidase
MLLLGVRPAGGSPGWHVLGRETFLAPVTWQDDWPLVGEPSLSLPAPSWPLQPGPAVPARDDFDVGDLSELRPHWISLRDRSPRHFSTKERPGWLTLHARGDGLDATDAVFLGRRQIDPSCGMRALLDPAEGCGGLAVRLDEEHHYAIEADAREVRAVARIGPLRTVLASRPLSPGPVVLRAGIARTQTLRDARTGPDTVTLGYEHPEQGFVALAELDGRYLSTEVAGGFTGRVLGMYAAAGTVHIDWCEYQPIQD